MVGYRVEIQGPVELHIEAAGVLDGLTLGVAVGVVGRCQGAELKGIQRIGGVDMEVAKVGFSVGGLLKVVAYRCRRRCSGCLAFSSPGGAGNGNLRVGIQIPIRVNSD